MQDELLGQRVTVVGLGIEGTALVRYLVEHGAHVTVSDAKPAEALADSLARIGALPVRLALGGHRTEDCVDAGLIFVSQGVPLDLPALQAAQQRGVPLRSATQLFMERCPAPILGVTGSAGKSTTTALIGEMFRAAGWPVFVGGNIGVILLDKLAEITPKDWVVLEISHTQLELTDRSPHIAVVTNISPSHADRYDMDAYIGLKKRIYAYQRPQDTLVLNWDDDATRAMARDARGKTAFFSLQAIPPDDGAFLQDGWVTLRASDAETRVAPVSEIRLLGTHNVANVLAAVAAGGMAGVPATALRHAIAGFQGVEHRLEWVRELDGVDYYNDSIATTPERTIAGLRALHRPIVLLAGGKDKNLPLQAWAREVTERCRAVVCFGAAGSLLEEALKPHWRGPEPLRGVESLEEAVTQARRVARPGDIVLLSPTCTSFDQYPNFEARGRHFKALVTAFPPQRSPIKKRD